MTPPGTEGSDTASSASAVRRDLRAVGSAGAEAASRDRERPPSNLPLELSSFVGGERELADMQLCLESAGQGMLVLVAGEPGIGKTRLVFELADRARAQGWQVLAGRAYQSGGMSPYLPFMEALRPYVRACPVEELRAQARPMWRCWRRRCATACPIFMRVRTQA